MKRSQKKPGRLVDTFSGYEAELNGPAEQPFFTVRFDATECNRMLKRLEECASSPHFQTPERRWFIMAATYENPARLRLIRVDTPKYELEAARNYFRGDILHVTGQEGSCNIKFAAVAARLLAEELRDAIGRMKKGIVLVVPNRHKKADVIEFIPDTESQVIDGDEQQRLAEAGAVLAGEVLPAEDFSHWPGAGGG